MRSSIFFVEFFRELKSFHLRITLGKAFSCCKSCATKTCRQRTSWRITSELRVFTVHHEHQMENKTKGWKNTAQRQKETERMCAKHKGNFIIHAYFTCLLGAKAVPGATIHKMAVSSEEAVSSVLARPLLHADTSAAAI